MKTQEIPNFQVEYIPSSFAFLTCMEVIDKTDSPTQIINVLSHVDSNKFNNFEQEYLKTMALNTVIHQSSMGDKELSEVFRNFNVPFETFSDLDYKLASLITEEDLKMFD
jgi:hypothetical protein